MPPTTLSTPNASSKSCDWALIFAVWVSLMLYGAIAAPVPAVNEPHYLTKARQYWQSDWCANDFFLVSPNAHTVFYVAIGWLTKWLSFEQTAWAGRAVAMLCLATGWTSLTTRLLGNRRSSLAGCWLFLTLASCGNLSGEWLVGGVEGKVFSYGLLFAALGQILRDRIVLAGGLAGAAVAFHPVVGLWGVLAVAGASLVMWGVQKADGELKSEGRRFFLSTLPALLLFALLALPGLIPVIQLLLEPATAATRHAATYIQVYYRLAHHLDPMAFPLRAYAGYSLLFVVWLIGLRGGERSQSQRLWDWIVAWSVVFALAGFAVGWGPRPAKLMPLFMERAGLLKFYPFRLVDVLLPLAVSLSLIRQLERRLLTPKPLMIGTLLLVVIALGRAHSITETNRYSNELRTDWIDACRWIDRHLPADAMVQAPHNGWAFKWFARRAEYVAFKDCPQDAAGIVEWNRRLVFLKKWYEDQYSDQFYSADELRDLRRLTKITHLLTDRLGPLELEPIYQNETFQIYDLSSLD